MRKKLVCLVMVLVMGVTLSSCHRIAGNQIDFYYLPTEFAFTDGKAQIDGGCGQIFHIDLERKEFSATNDGSYGYAQPVVQGGTAPRYALEIEEDYQGVEKYLLALEIKDNERSVIYTQGYLMGKNIYGICNVYEDTVGYLSGGGNYGEEEISYSVYYRYDVTADTFSVIFRAEGALTVAFSNKKVVCWKDKNLYLFNVETQEEKFICKDYSYDSGLQRQSRGSVYFNSEHAIFYFAEARLFSEKHYAYILDFSCDEVIELACK